MLRRTPLGMSEESEGNSQQSERRLSTPIYPQNPCVVTAKEPGTRWPDRDLLLRLFRDQRFHPAEELEQAVPDGRWIKALGELLASNYIFDIFDNHLKIRDRGDGERRMKLVDLLEKIDVAKKIKIPELELELRENEDTGEIKFGDEDIDTPTPLNETGLMSISDPADILRLSIEESSTMVGVILAKRHSGKTYLGMVIAEEFMSGENPIPLVVLDPTGVWHGLRAASDGQPSPFAVLVFGGDHGDISISSDDGSRVAAVVDEIRPHPVVVDLSGLAPVEQHEFVADFIDRLYATTIKSPIHLVIDEADEYAPQVLSRSSRHQKRCLDAVDRLVRRGRTKGIGITLISQRCAVLAKNVLSQADSFWFLHMVEPRDLSAVETRLNNGVTPRQRQECINQIPRLQPGIAYFVHTGTNPQFKRFQVRRKRTFDSSKTPTMKGHVSPIFARVPSDILSIAESYFVITGDEEGGDE